jgi:hypothetical protein
VSASWKITEQVQGTLTVATLNCGDWGTVLVAPLSDRNAVLRSKRNVQRSASGIVMAGKVD